MQKDKLLSQLQQQDWTSHNIVLTPKLSTLSNTIPLIGDDTRTQVIRKNLQIFQKNKKYNQQRALDLGCLEGGLTIEMAKLGFDSLGIEGQASNYQKCQLLKDYFSWSNLDFLLADVKQLTPKNQGVFDVILCCGLLYHLDEPVPFLAQLETLMHAQGFLFLDTHIAPEDEDLAICHFKDGLSEMVEINHQGYIYSGRWFLEYNDESEKKPWTSVSNKKSFWLTHDSLIRALSHAGFSHIYKPYGSFELEEEFKLRQIYSRLYLIAIKDSYFAND